MTSQNQDSWKKVGKIKDAHGLRGDLYVLIFSKETDWADELKDIALALPESENQKQVFKVKKWKDYRDGIMLTLEGISDRTQAERLKGQHFFIPEDLLVSDDGETIFLSEIEGFEIVNSNQETLGKITGFSSNIAQDLLIVEKSQGGEAEIPFVEDFIVEIDFEAHKIEMDLPEGIWDLASL